MKNLTDKQLQNLLNIKNINEFNMLKYIFENKEASQAEISENLNLSPPTVSRNLSPFLENKILKITGKKKSNKIGRKAEIIEFNDYYKILGIQIDKDFVKYGVFSLNHKVFEFQKIDVDASDFYKLKTSLTNQLKKIFRYKIISTAIAFPGYISGNEVISSSIVNWNPVYSDELVKTINCIFSDSIVSFENDANLLAFRERFLEKDKRNLLCIYWGHGIGMGIVINGELYTGEGMAGELGQTTFYKNNLEEYLRNLNRKQIIQTWIDILDSLNYIFHPEKIILNSPFSDTFDEVVQTYNNLKNIDKGNAKVETSFGGDKAIVEGAAILASELFLRELTQTREI